MGDIIKIQKIVVGNKEIVFSQNQILPNEIQLAIILISLIIAVFFVLRKERKI